MANEVGSFDLNEPHERGALTLTIRKESFASFIQSLLGEPRSIERTYAGTYVIDLRWLTNLDAILMQRVNSQHHADLIEFSAKVFFSSGAIKKVSTRDAFLAFADNSDDLTIGVSLSWIFLIKFPHSTTPEKQRIRFDALEGFDAGILGSPFAFDIPVLKRWRGPSTIRLIVEHTEITWGDDIFHHLSNQVRKIMVQRSKPYKIVDKLEDFLASGYTGAVYFSVIFVFLLSQLATSKKSVSAALIDQAKAINGLADGLQAANLKLDLLLRQTFSDLSDALILTVLQVVLAIAFFIAANGLARKLRVLLAGKTFINLNSATERKLHEYERSNTVYTVAVAIGFAVNVAAALFLEKIAPFAFSLLRSLAGM